MQVRNWLYKNETAFGNYNFKGYIEHIFVLKKWLKAIYFFKTKLFLPKTWYIEHGGFKM